MSLEDLAEPLPIIPIEDKPAVAQVNLVDTPANVDEFAGMVTDALPNPEMSRDDQFEESLNRFSKDSLAPDVQAIFDMDAVETQQEIKSVIDEQMRQGNADAWQMWSDISDADWKEKQLGPNGNKVLRDAIVREHGLIGLSARVGEPIKNQDKLEEAVNKGTIRDVVGRLASKEDVPLTDFLTYLGMNILPVGANLLERQFAKIARKALDIEETFSDKVTDFVSTGGLFRDFRAKWVQMNDDERRGVLTRLNDLSKKDFGLLGNGAAFVMFLTRIADYGDAEWALDVAGNLLTVADVVAVGSALKNIKSAGASARLANETSGGKAAANLVVEDVTKGVMTSGLSKEELLDSLQSTVKAWQGELAARLEGISSPAQRQLIERTNRMLNDAHQRLIATARTPEALERGTQELMARYMADTDPSIRAVEFFPSADGETINVRVQRVKADGTEFASEAEALKYKLDNNLSGNVVRVGDYKPHMRWTPDGPQLMETIPAGKPRIKWKQRKDMPRAEQAQLAWRGTGEIWDEFEMPLHTGQLGFGLSTTKRGQIANLFARKNAKVNGGRGYRARVEIPEDDQFLNLQKPFSGQSESVKSAIRKLLGDDPLLDQYRDGFAIKVAMEMKLGEGKDLAQAMYDAGMKGLYNPKKKYGTVEPGMGYVPGGDFNEHLVFNPKDVRIKYWEEVPPLQAKNAARISEEDVAADEFLMSLYKQEQASIGIPDSSTMGKGYNTLMAAAEKDPALARALEYLWDTEGKVYEKFENLKRMSFMGDVPAKEARTIQGWSQILGMGEDNIFVVHGYEAVIDFYRRAGYSMDDIADSLLRLKQNKGMMNRLNLSGDSNKPIFVIMQKESRDSYERMFTWAHELAHVFDHAIFARMPKHIRAAFDKARREWQAKLRKGMTYREAMRQLRVASEDEMKLVAKPLGSSVDNVMKGDNVPGATDAEVGVFNWYYDSQEFFAENMAKWLLTDARPVGVLEQWFKDAAATLKAMFKNAAENLGFRTDPNPTIARFMEEYLAGKFKSEMNTRLTTVSGGSNLLNSIETTLPDWNAADVIAKHVAKPRIKLKSKSSGELPPPPAVKSTVATTPAERWMIVENRREVPLYEGLGKYDKDDIDGSPTFAIDPKHAASENAVASRMIGVHAEAKVFTALRDYLDEFWAGLSTKSRKKVEAVLEEGDSASNLGGSGKEFDYSELRAKGLDDKEAQAYFAVRSVRFVSHSLRNEAMARVLKGKGYQQIVLAGGGRVYHGKVLLGGERPTKGQIYDLDLGKAVPAKDIDWSKETRKVVELGDERNMMGKDFTLFIGDSKNFTISDIKEVVPYRKGEYARVYTDQYFVKGEKSKFVNGEAVTVPFTFRTAMTASEATKYVDDVSAAVEVLKSVVDGTLTKEEVFATVAEYVGKYYDDVGAFIKDALEGDLAGVKNIRWEFNRTGDKFTLGQIENARFDGRTFTSERGAKLHSVDAKRRNTMTPLESISAEVNNISKVSNIIEWRDTQIKMWMESFGHMVARTGDDIADFFRFNPGSLPKTDKEYLFAKRTHQYIMRQVGTPTNEDKWYDTVTRVVSEQFLDSKYVPSWMGAAVRNMSPINFLRSVNFNLMLGAFNPAQLVVQANGAATAMFLHPIHGIKAAGSFPLYRQALMSDRPDVWRKIYKLNIGNIQMNEEEFIEAVTAINKSGLIRNTKSTALWNKEAGALGIGHSRLYNAISRNHTFFFDRGEEFSRIVSFDVARREWKQANKGKKMDDFALKSILEKADNYTQNMTKANLARWQEGVMSIPLQFAQYNIKLALNVMSSLFSDSGKAGRSFTKAEAAKLVAYHTIMYGAAGIGIKGMVDEWLPEEATKDMDESTKLAIGQGMVSWVAQMVYGGEEEGPRLNLGERLGAMSYFHQMYDTIVNDGSLVKVAFGPTAGSLEKLGKLGKAFAPLIWQDQLTAGDIMDGINELGAETFASWGNMHKSFVYRNMNNKLINAKGEKVADLRESEILAKATGFSSVHGDDYWSLVKSKKQHTELLTSIANEIKHQHLRYMIALNQGDYAKADRLQKLMWTLLPENGGDRNAVLKMVWNASKGQFPYDTKLQKELGKWFHDTTSAKKPLVITSRPEKGSE